MYLVNTFKYSLLVTIINWRGWQQRTQFLWKYQTYIHQTTINSKKRYQIKFSSIMIFKKKKSIIAN